MDTPFPTFTPAEKAYLRGCLPSEEEVIVGWALPVLARPASERAVLIAAEVEVLENLCADPISWCYDALTLAEKRGGGHAH